MTDFDDSAPAATVPLDQKREELTARLRAARAALSPKAAVAAAAVSGDVAEAADLAASVAIEKAAAARSGFQPRSMTMKLILERPEVTVRVVLAILTVLFGARLATQVGSAAAFARTLKLTLDDLGGQTPRPS